VPSQAADPSKGEARLDKPASLAASRPSRPNATRSGRPSCRSVRRRVETRDELETPKRARSSVTRLRARMEGGTGSPGSLSRQQTSKQGPGASWRRRSSALEDRSPVLSTRRRDPPRHASDPVEISRSIVEDDAVEWSISITAGSRSPGGSLNSCERSGTDASSTSGQPRLPLGMRRLTPTRARSSFSSAARRRWRERQARGVRLPLERRAGIGERRRKRRVRVPGNGPGKRAVRAASRSTPIGCPIPTATWVDRQKGSTDEWNETASAPALRDRAERSDEPSPNGRHAETRSRNPAAPRGPPPSGGAAVPPDARLETRFVEFVEATDRGARRPLWIERKHHLSPRVGKSASAGVSSLGRAFGFPGHVGRAASPIPERWRSTPARSEVLRNRDGGSEGCWRANRSREAGGAARDQSSHQVAGSDGNVPQDTESRGEQPGDVETCETDAATYRSSPGSQTSKSPRDVSTRSTRPAPRASQRVLPGNRGGRRGFIRENVRPKPPGARIPRDSSDGSSEGQVRAVAPDDGSTRPPLRAWEGDDSGAVAMEVGIR